MRRGGNWDQVWIFQCVLLFAATKTRELEKGAHSECNLRVDVIYAVPFQTNGWRNKPLNYLLYSMCNEHFRIHFLIKLFSHRIIYNEDFDFMRWTAMPTDRKLFYIWLKKNIFSNNYSFMVSIYFPISLVYILEKSWIWQLISLFHLIIRWVPSIKMNTFPVV